MRLSLEWEVEDSNLGRSIRTLFPLARHRRDITSKEAVLPGRNDAVTGPANSLHALAYFSKYNERFEDLTMVKVFIRILLMVLTPFSWRSTKRLFVTFYFAMTKATRLNCAKTMLELKYRFSIYYIHINYFDNTKDAVEADTENGR